MSSFALPASSSPTPARLGFVLKIGATLALLLLADWLSSAGRYWLGPTTTTGAQVGLFAGLWLVAIVALQPSIRRSRPASSAAVVALVLAGLLAFDPGSVFALLFLTAIALMVLLPRCAGFDNAWRWFKRLLLFALFSMFAPFQVLFSWGRVHGRRKRRSRFKTLGVIASLMLPLVGTGVFLVLFADANPLIGRFFDGLDLRTLFRALTPQRFVFWVMLAPVVWGILRPVRMRLLLQKGADTEAPARVIPGVSLASVTLSLVSFNLLFALQNALDIAFLWSGAPLPDGMTLASYAHGGAYPLIVTALLAALFVLVTLRPGSAMAASRLLRALVSLWIAQNIFLVASSILRTLDYVGMYSLTAWRIAAIVWMGLVALGLALICWRLIAERSAAWLINANVAAALLSVTVVTLLDPDAIAAQWNVRHNRELTGVGAVLDINYLRGLGPSALLPLIELQRQPIDPELQASLHWMEEDIRLRMERDQADWRSWTPRNAWRLAQAARPENVRPPLTNPSDR